MIVRRHVPGDAPGIIPAAFPLPPANGMLRLSVPLAPEEISARVAPLTLRAARDEAPPTWQRTIHALLELAAELGVEPRVYGSLLWQRLTGLSYLTAGSDLDLLWPIIDEETATRVVGHIAMIARESPVRCDGEILLPDGSGVQWREWHEHPTGVLVKTSAAVRLCATRDLFPRVASVP